MAFENLPGRVYSDPVTWHADTIYRVHGPSAGTYNHDIYYRSTTGGPVVFNSNYNANGFFNEEFGGPYPGTDATGCAWSKVVLGRAISRTWDGICPFDDDGPSTDIGDMHGSFFETETNGPSAFNDTSTANVGIGGYLLRPWMLPTFGNPWMEDDDLEDEYVTAEFAAFAALPGDGWSVEWENYYPLLQSLDVAPDETITGTLGLRTEGITYLYDPPPGRYAFYGIDSEFGPQWGSGLATDGTELIRYTGGEADWITVPEWQPTQDTSAVFFGGQFEVPEDENAASIPLTAVCDTVLTGAYPGDNASGGRDNQTLLARSAWTLPRFRFYRELGQPYPIRTIGRGKDGLVGSGEQTFRRTSVQRSIRTIGSQR